MMTLTDGKLLVAGTFIPGTVLYHTNNNNNNTAVIINYKNYYIYILYFIFYYLIFNYLERRTMMEKIIHIHINIDLFFSACYGTHISGYNVPATRTLMVATLFKHCLQRVPV